MLFLRPDKIPNRKRKRKRGNAQNAQKQKLNEFLTRFSLSLSAAVTHKHTRTPLFTQATVLKRTRRKKWVCRRLFMGVGPKGGANTNLINRTTLLIRATHFNRFDKLAEVAQYGGFNSIFAAFSHSCRQGGWFDFVQTPPPLFIFVYLVISPCFPQSLIVYGQLRNSPGDL